MKTVKQLLFVLALICTSNIMYGQLGIRVGVNLANQKFETQGISIEPSSIVGLNAALVYNIDVSDLFAVQPELHFVQKGSEIEIPGLDNFKTTFNYLELAIAAKFNVVKFGESSKVYVAVSPAAGYAISGTSKVGENSSDIEFDDDNNRLDFGVGLGAGVQFGSLFLDIRYNIGLADLNTLDDETVKNNGILIGIGYMF